ncbi:MAG: GldG family protein, partial [Deltaproteobacteria bacterium]|nr:GldG family protein [Deltaproteobacteria bacterium]
MTAFFSFLIPFRFQAVILGLVSILLSGLVRFFLPEISGAALHLLILGLVLVFISALGSLGEIKTFLGSKQGRYSTNTVIMVGVFIAIIALLNLAGLTRHKRIDLTATSKFTLAPQTQRIIRELKQPVEAIGFFPNDSQYQAAQRSAQNLLEEYRYFNRKFSFRFVDPDAKPAVAKQYRVKANGTIIFISGDRQRALGGPSEQGFTGALLEVTGIEAKKIYFLSGHGERDVNNLREDGYAAARTGLIRDLYKVETLNLTLTPEVPEDCAVLVVSGPKKAIPEAEAKAVYNYLKNHGKVLALL